MKTSEEMSADMVHAFKTIDMILEFEHADRDDVDELRQSLQDASRYNNILLGRLAAARRALMAIRDNATEPFTVKDYAHNAVMATSGVEVRY